MSANARPDEQAEGRGDDSLQSAVMGVLTGFTRTLSRWSWEGTSATAGRCGGQGRDVPLRSSLHQEVSNPTQSLLRCPL